MNKLELKDIAVSFNSKQILNNISFELKKGNIYGLLGLNGAGKTTIIRCIFNEVFDYSGEIKVDDEKINKSHYAKMYYFVENGSLAQSITIYDLLQSEAFFRKISKETFNNKIQEFQTALPNINFKRKFIKDLSSGQQKLVSLFCAMLVDPEIIFLDEPTANLDLENKKYIINFIKKLKAEDKIIVLVTHLVEEIQESLDYVIVLDNGKIQCNKKINNNQSALKIFEEHVKFKNESFGNLGKSRNKKC